MSAFNTLAENQAALFRWPLLPGFFELKRAAHDHWSALRSVIFRASNTSNRHQTRIANHKMIRVIHRFSRDAVNAKAFKQRFFNCPHEKFLRPIGSPELRYLDMHRQHCLKLFTASRWSSIEPFSPLHANVNGSLTCIGSPAVDKLKHFA